MKKAFILLILLICLQGFSQYTIHGSDGQTIYTSTGTFSLGSYIPGNIYEVTICSPDPMCSHISLVFDQWTIGSGNFCVYDGNTTSSTLIGCNAWGVTQTVSASPSNTTGCLTIQFMATSAGSDIGWVIGCEFSCQDILAGINPSISGFENFGILGMAIEICENQIIEFSGSGIYQNTTYTQDNSSSVFTWYLNNEVVHIGEEFSHLFNENGSYKLDLEITDVAGCSNSNSNSHYIIHGVAASIGFSPLNFSTYSVGDTIDLFASILFGNELDCSNPLYIPDGTGPSLFDTIHFEQFEEGQIFEDVEDLLAVCVNMEHSYLGDVLIYLTCPYNVITGAPVTVNLHHQHGGGTHLGEPLDYSNGGEPPGIGYDYCFTTPALAEYPNTLGNIGATYSTLPSGSYTTSEPLDAFVGCKLNGDWILQIHDNWATDDGWLFCWDIQFTPELYPIPTVFQVDYDTSYWEGNNLIYSDSVFAQSVPEEAGLYTYVFNIFDNSGCHNQYFLNLFVLDNPSVVSGRIYNDYNSNCIYDEIENPIVGKLVRVDPGPYFTTSNSEGNYTIYLDEGSYSVSNVLFAYDNIICPTDNVHYINPELGEVLTDLDFANNLPDYADLIINLGCNSAVNFLEFVTYAYVKNIGNITVTDISLEIGKDNLQEFLYSNTLPFSVSDSLIIWEIDELMPGQAQSIFAYYDITSYSIGDTLINNAYVHSSFFEEDTSNNYSQKIRVVSSSYDPNFKSVFPFGEMELESIVNSDSILHFTIYFQNTGTSPAQNIVILDTLSTLLDISSFQTEGSSHEFFWSISNNGLLQVSFPDIMLADSLTNEPESHGHVSYSIKLRETINIGNIITNTAHIYFDFNEPIVTNTTVNTIVDSTVGIGDKVLNNIVLYPNPTSSELNILPKGKYSFEVINLLGETLFCGTANRINVETLEPGVYIISLKDAAGKISIGKFVRE
jgi:uncharacterized repeat protein (TIGR01451 family)